MSCSDETIERLEKLASAGDWPTAEQEIRAALSGDSQHPKLHELLGRCLVGQRRFADGIAALELASTSGPLDFAGEAALAHGYAHTGRAELAAWIFRDLRQRSEVPSELLADGACMLGSVGESLAAMEVCEELHRRHPECHKAAFGVAYYMNRMGRPAEEILPLLEYAYGKDPGCVMYRLGMAFCLDRLGRSFAAWEVLRGLRLEDVHWPHCLSRIMEIASTVGDNSRLLECQVRLRELAGATGGHGCG